MQHRVRHRADDEVELPPCFGERQARLRAAQRFCKTLGDFAELLREEWAQERWLFGEHATDHRAWPRSAFVRELHHGRDECLDDGADRSRAGRSCVGFDGLEALHARSVHGSDAAQHHGLGQLLLAAEVVVHGGEVGLGLLRDRAQRHRGIADFGEQPLGGVEDRGLGRFGSHGGRAR